MGWFYRLKLSDTGGRYSGAATQRRYFEKLFAIKERLSKIVRVDLDDSDKMQGWKFSEHEMRGVPLRLELGQRMKRTSVIVRRDTREKIFISLEELETRIPDTCRYAAGALERQEQCVIKPILPQV